MLRHLVQRAAHCQQTITYECRGSRLPGYGWWVSCVYCCVMCFYFHVVMCRWVSGAGERREFCSGQSCNCVAGPGAGQWCPANCVSIV